MRIAGNGSAFLLNCSTILTVCLDRRRGANDSDVFPHDWNPLFRISSLLLLPSLVSHCFFFCFWPILLTSFSLNCYFSKGRLFCVALVLFGFKQLGDEYFSWWYVQDMLPYIALILLIRLYTFI